MHIDAEGQEISQGSWVKIIQPETYWFNYMSEENYLLLQQACRYPLKVNYLDEDGRVTVLLPETVETDGDFVTNSLTLATSDILVIENDL